MLAAEFSAAETTERDTFGFDGFAAETVSTVMYLFHTYTPIYNHQYAELKNPTF